MDYKTIKSIAELPPGQAVLYGAGSYGQYVYGKISKERPDLSIKAFVDDVKSGSFSGLPVMGSQSIPEGVAVLITSSYWKDILLKNKFKNPVFVADILSGPASGDQISIDYKGNKIHFFTPNLFLEEVGRNIFEIEPGMLEWIESFEAGSVFYDVGASNGCYGILAGFGRELTVVCFEPDVQNFAILDHNYYLNRHTLKKFYGFNIALSDKSEIAKFHCQNFFPGSHGKVLESSGREDLSASEVEFERAVISKTLDEMVFNYKLPMPDYLKIDVDGAESLILKGAEKVLESGAIRSCMIESEIGEIDGIKILLQQKGFYLKEEYAINEVTLSRVSGVKNYLFLKRSTRI